MPEVFWLLMRLHCTVLALLATVALALPAAAQSSNEAASFRVFLRGSAIGGEDVVVRRTPEGVTITSSGRLAAPLDLVMRQCVIRYDVRWRPLELSVDAMARGAALSIKTSFADGRAESEVTQAGAPTRKTDVVSADPVVLPNVCFSAYEALALRLGEIADGGSIRAYVAPQAEIAVTRVARTDQKVETARRVIDVRSYALAFQNPGGALDATVWTDESGRLLKLEIPAQSLIVVREDLASVATRALVISRDGDLSVRIPGNGFNLAGTLSQPSGTPPAESRGRFPAVVLVGGSGPTDRDETVAGLPIFGLLAGPLADAGYYVLRYDKRGVGQSGGRGETATLQDFAEDVRGAVKFLRERRDVDPKRIVLFGHSEGGLVALLAASRDDDIAGVVLAAVPSGTGAELVLEQQAYLLGRMNLSDAERASRIDLQKRIQAAVLGGGPWDDVPEPLRRQAETPWFESFLRFSPAPLMSRVKQPLLILQGSLDRQVPQHHGEKLAELAKARKRGGDAVSYFVLDGVNHLLVQAKTGDVDEYGSLAGRGLDPRVAQNTVDWMGTLAKK
jgi:alpha-beta hydrolase superfamily lysophospholipase